MLQTGQLSLMTALSYPPSQKKRRRPKGEPLYRTDGLSVDGPKRLILHTRVTPCMRSESNCGSDRQKTGGQGRRRGVVRRDGRSPSVGIGVVSQL